ncbi:MAG: hypothetical protein ABSH46_19155 [Bryobacteraceae bacterium]
MRPIAGWLVDVLRHPDDSSRLARVCGEVKARSAAFPIPGAA